MKKFMHIRRKSYQTASGGFFYFLRDTLSVAVKLVLLKFMCYTNSIK